MAQGRPNLYCDGELYCDFILTVKNCKGAEAYEAFVRGHIPVSITMAVLGTLHYLLFRLLIKKTKTFTGWRMSGTDGVLLATTAHCATQIFVGYWLVEDWIPGSWASRAVYEGISFMLVYLGVMNWVASMVVSVSEVEAFFDHRSLFSPRVLTIFIWSLAALYWVVCLILTGFFGHAHDIGDYQLEWVLNRVLYNHMAVMSMLTSLLIFVIAFQFHSFVSKSLSSTTDFVDHDNMQRKKMLLESKKMMMITVFAATGVSLEGLTAFLLGNVQRIYTLFPGWSQLFQVIVSGVTIYISAGVILLVIAVDLWGWFHREKSVSLSSSRSTPNETVKPRAQQAPIQMA